MLEYNKKKALIIGINGQDGSFLAEALKNKNYSVSGVSRQANVRLEIKSYIDQYFTTDLSDFSALNFILEKVQPDVIYYTAAIHGALNFAYEEYWQHVHYVNTMAVHNILEYLRKEKLSSQIIYFSSSKVFGDLSGKTINEGSKKNPSCIYSISKVAAETLVALYREKFGIKASVVWLFNHESERRKSDYFVMIIMDALKKSIMDRSFATTVQSLDFWCDWGHAQEFMELVSEYYSKVDSQDIVLGTGETLWARDVVSQFFQNHNLDYSQHISTNFSAEKNELQRWKVDNSKFQKELGNFELSFGIKLFDKIFEKLNSEKNFKT